MQREYETLQIQYDALLEQYEFLSDELYFVRAETSTHQALVDDVNDDESMISASRSVQTFPVSKIPQPIRKKASVKSITPEEEENAAYLNELRRGLQAAMATTQVFSLCNFNLDSLEEILPRSRK